MDSFTYYPAFYSCQTPTIITHSKQGDRQSVPFYDYFFVLFRFGMTWSRRTRQPRALSHPKAVQYL